MSVSTTRQQRIREIDFRRPAKFTRDQVRRVEVAHEAFSQAATSRLSAELRAEFRLGDASPDQLPYSVFLHEEAPQQALFAILDVEPIDTQVALIFDLKLAVSFASRLLGGPLDAPEGECGLTAVEGVVARRAIEALIDTLSNTWQDLAGITFSLAYTTTSVMSVQLVPPSEPTLFLRMPTTLGPLESEVTLVLPHRSIEPVAEKLEHGHYGPEAGDGHSREEMQSAVRTVDVELRAEVAAIDVPVADVLKLTPGDVVRLKRPVSRGIVVHVDEVPAYVAQPGRNGNVRAVQIEEPWTPSP